MEEEVVGSTPVRSALLILIGKVASSTISTRLNLGEEHSIFLLQLSSKSYNINNPPSTIDQNAYCLKLAPISV